MAMENKSTLYEKVLGCLVGGLIGDAMGAPGEGKTYGQIEEEYGQLVDFEGAGTDDSAIKLILCDAILRNGGYVTADEWAESFLTHRESYRLFYIPVRNMFHKIESKLSLPVYAGLGNMHSSSSAMSISPMGLINACNPRQAALETYDVAGLIHAGVSTFCRDGACAIAAAIAEATKPNATTASVIDASTAYLHKTSSAEMRGCIREAIELATSSGDYESFREGYYRTNLRDIISDSRETVPCVLALFYLSNGDPVKAILYGANFGRDADTIGTMVGALSGAYKGVNGLKREWVDKVMRNMPEQRHLAEQMTEVIQARMDDLRDSMALYDQLV